jgi:hypothetical protein
MPDTPSVSTELNVQDLLSKGAPFKPIDTVSLNTTSDELLQQIQDHQREGLPLVITGLNTDPGWPHKLLSGEDFRGKKVQSKDGPGIVGVTIFVACTFLTYCTL